MCCVLRITSGPTVRICHHYNTLKPLLNYGIGGGAGVNLILRGFGALTTGRFMLDLAFLFVRVFIWSCFIVNARFER